MAVTVPDWADALLDLIGVNWPNVDEDAYRDMADSLREFADGILDDGHLANQHVQRLLSSGEGEAMSALNSHWGKVKNKHIEDLAGAGRTIAGALDKAAGAIEAMKYVAIGHLGVLAGKAGVSLALIPVTGGLSALIGAGAMAACQQLVRKAIKECMNEVVGYLVAAATEPAVAALESMAADLAVQAGATALGLQEAVDLDRTAQAGRDSLTLASADGSDSSGGGPGSMVRIAHEEHDRAGARLNTVSLGMHGKTRGKLDKARSHHGRNRGRDDIAQALDPLVDKAMEALGKATTTMGDHLGRTLPASVRQVSKDNRDVDTGIEGRINRVRRVDGDGGNGAGNPGGAFGGGKDSKGDGPAGPAPLDRAKEDPRRNGISLKDTQCEGDPVDVATGEMILPYTDLALPGVLPLVLRRTHLSEYRYGQWFGRSWASTLDERIELDATGRGAIWAREDGSILIYPSLPAPDDGAGVLPVEGARLPLTHGGQQNAVVTYHVTDPCSGLVRTFSGSPYNPSPAHWLTELEDRHGNGITIDRRDDGAPVRIRHDAGYTVLVATRSSRVHEISLRTPDGPVTTTAYGYDANGDLDAVVNSSGLPLRFSYDVDGRITSWTDRNNSTFRYAYDSGGRVIATTGPDGHLSATIEYDEESRATRYTNSLGATKSFHANDLLQVVAETDALGNTTRRTWDRHDRLLSRTDPLGHLTTQAYDQYGNLTGIRHPDGAVARVTHNERHQITAVTAADGVIWRQEYDEHGNPTVFARPDGTGTRLTHDARGRLTGVADDNGPLHRLRCDAAGLPLEICSPQGTVTCYERDAFGRPVRITGPDGAATVLDWTVEGRLSRRTTPDGSEELWTYDGEGNCLTHTDPSGGETRFAYTHFDLVAARTTSDGAHHTFEYDTELRLTRITNPTRLTWQYVYDAAGRLVSETDFDGRVLTYTHDAAGRLGSRTNGAGQSVRYERDPAGRVVAKDAHGVVTRFRYDPLGRLVRATGPGIDLTHVRDSAGRLVKETVNGRELTNSYDVSGRRIHRTTPSGAVSAWSYPNGGAELETSGHRVVFGFDGVGRETTRSIGDHLSIDSTYDELGRPTSQHVQADGVETVQRRSYTYRADGLLTAVDDLFGGRQELTLGPGARVTGVSADGWNERYAYDEAGNQTDATSPVDPDADGPRTYIGTRIARAGRIRYEHDDQGRVTLRQKSFLSRKPVTWRYTWDAEDHLIEVSTPDGTRWRHLYDPLGRRVAKERLTPDGEQALERTDFTWDGDVLCEQSTISADAPVATVLTWDHDGRRPLTQTERKISSDSSRREIAHRFFAIVTDLVGAPRELVNEHGEIVWRARTALWGTTGWNRSASAYTPLRFPGQYADPETGLHYNHHRHYDPAVGRYLSPDPLGLTPAPNAFTYVDNPTAWIDPLGLAGCPHRGGEHRHSVVLGPNQPAPNGPSNNLARYLRNDPGDPGHEPNRPQDPGAHTYNGREYSGLENGSPVWMQNVAHAIDDRGTTLSITLDGMPDARGERGDWDTPETITEAFRTAVQYGSQFNISREADWPPAGSGGTAWEMSVVAYAVRKYDTEAAWGDPEEERSGRPWEEIHWYSNNERIEVPKPDIPEIKPRKLPGE